MYTDRMRTIRHHNEVALAARTGAGWPVFWVKGFSCAGLHTINALIIFAPDAVSMKETMCMHVRCRRFTDSVCHRCEVTFAAQIGA